ncbi:hypothetical protein [Nocardia cyriacigeorgica]|uniref:CHAT domain-containing protein n=1 Tax=Nocardia cyriacigeorgica (strain GUH-2) TaxID=1127134 RepID=H6QZ76_NOCCG|nr:hypothetical protein [Nocardia cyriacigeorgica]BDT86442.1 CHAT domain-containing protein [Nocardia cyriacigeorgica]CCF62830.1 protein of unknown function; putative coiled-coil domains [Nocardia cyriacigeorgica GUH-2]
MSANQYRSQLNNKRKQRIDAEKKAGEFRTKESKKRAEAAAARLAASKSKTDSTVKSKLREAERKDKEAETAGKEAGQWQLRASTYAKSEVDLQTKLAKAEKSEADAAELKRKREEQRTQRLAAGQRAELESRVASTESAVEHVLRKLPAPKPEKLRVLILGASGEGDLRVGREQKRIRMAVDAALHRDQIDFDVRPAATPADLLNGLSGFRPHVIHFSGHSGDDFLVFEQDTDELNSGMDVAAGAFARAIQATDTPPLLVLLNSCNSAAQIDGLVEVVPFAIGMADEIDDGDAINYAAQFYASITDGQSINSAHLSGRSALELAGLRGADLPTLKWAPDVDPSVTILVKAME